MQNRVPFLLLTCFGLSVALLNAQKVANGVAAQSSVEQRPKVSPITKIEKTALAAPVFIENVGQFNPKVKFQVKIGSQAVWLTSEGIVFDATRPAAEEKVVTPDPKTADSANGQDPLQPFALKRARPESRIIDRLVFSEDFVGASCCSKVEGKNPQAGVYNYFQGHDPKEWRTNVRGYAEVVYRDVWPGVDLRVYGNGSDLEQEFIVQPGGDLGQVQISYRGIDGLNVAKDESLEVATAFGTLRETKPRLYQQIAGKQIAVDGRFKLTGDNAYSFEIGAHEAQYALVIDPTLLYSTFLGGTAGSNAYVSFSSQLATGVGVDSSGNAYVAGNTASTDFPTTLGSYQASPPSGTFISKLNATGSALVYSTYLGYSASITAMAVDSSGRAYVIGETSATYYLYGSNNYFPTTPNAYWPTDSQHHCASTDFYMTALNPTGNGLYYSTCFNISGNAAYAAEYGYYPKAITVDSNGRAYIAGGAADGVPTTSNAYQPSFPGGASAYLAIFDTTASGSSSLVYATFLGPANSQFSASANGVTVDLFGKVYLTGSTSAGGFPVTSGAFQTTPAPCIPNGNLCPASSNSFIAKLDPSVAGSQSLIYSTYFGGMGHTSTSVIAVDSAGNAYVAGNTDGSYYQSFPVTPGAFQSTAGQNGSAGFVTKLNASGSKLVYSTLLAGNIYANGNSTGGIAVDSLGNAYVAGSFRAQTQSTFPVTPDAFQNSFSKLSGDYSEAFLTKLNPTGSALIYSSYLGGNGSDQATSVAIDQTGDAYVAGFTTSPNFPVTPTAFQPALNLGGGYRYPQAAFVTKFPLGIVNTLSISSISPTSGGNAGIVTINVLGGGFHNGASVSLVGGSIIPGNAPAVGSEGRTISVAFDLTAAVAGVYSLVVGNPDGTTVTLSQAFTVQQGGSSNLQISLTGLAVTHGSTYSVVDITVTNTGNVDVPSSVVWFPAESPFFLTSVSPTAIASIGEMAADFEALWITDPLAPGTSQSFTATTANPSGVGASLLVGAGVRDLAPHVGTTGNASGISVGVGGNVLNPQTSAAATMNSSSQGAAVSYTECITAEALTLSAFSQCSNIPLHIDCGANAFVSCQIVDNKPLYPTLCKSEMAQCLKDINKCTDTLHLPLQQQIDAACRRVSCSPGQPCTELHVVFPVDPNSLVGTSGVGNQGWLAGTQPLTYIIAFNNEPSASVPAQQVIVTQPLGSNVNLSNLSLLGINIPNGSNAVQTYVPAGAFNPSVGINEFNTNVDLRPVQNLLVNVDALLNPVTQTLSWTLTSIDPATGQLPVNPLVGFLPPGAGASLSFSVTPKQGLATGTQIAEQASIVFVGASPINTPTWVNTIDNTPPISHVSALPAPSTCTAFRVSWSGSDVGSGLQGFTIYVSDSGGPFTAWLSNTTAASANFQGSLGHTYAFYSIAVDLTGNAEAGKTSAEATTSVTASGPCGAPSLSGQASNVAQSGTAVTLNLQLTNTGFTAAQAVNINQITFRTLSGSGTVTLASPVLPAAEGPLGIGASITVPLTLNVPATVTRFSMTEGGNLKDGVGNTYNYSMAQTVIP